VIARLTVKKAEDLSARRVYNRSGQSYKRMDDGELRRNRVAVAKFPAYWACDSKVMGLNT
jgi:hypothetical protein